MSSQSRPLGGFAPVTHSLALPKDWARPVGGPEDTGQPIPGTQPAEQDAFSHLPEWQRPVFITGESGLVVPQALTLPDGGLLTPAQDPFGKLPDWAKPAGPAYTPPPQDPFSKLPSWARPAGDPPGTLQFPKAGWTFGE